MQSLPYWMCFSLVRRDEFFFALKSTHAPYIDVFKENCTLRKMWKKSWDRLVATNWLATDRSYCGNRTTVVAQHKISYLFYICTEIIQLYEERLSLIWTGKLKCCAILFYFFFSSLSITTVVHKLRAMNRTAFYAWILPLMNRKLFALDI